MFSVKVSVLPLPVVEVPFTAGMTVAQAFESADYEITENHSVTLDTVTIGADDVIKDNGRDNCYLYATKNIKGAK